MKTETKRRIEKFIRRHNYDILAAGLALVVIISIKKMHGPQPEPLTEDEMRMMEEFSVAMDEFIDKWNADHQ